jgi:hypothetical protein
MRITFVNRLKTGSVTFVEVNGTNFLPNFGGGAMAERDWKSGSTNRTAAFGRHAGKKRQTALLFSSQVLGPVTHRRMTSPISGAFRY